MMSRALAVLLLLLPGCADEDSRPATGAYVASAIFVPTCATASCHSRLTEAADLVLEGDPLAIVADLKERTLVAPRHPDQSPLVHLLRGRYTAVRMPPDAPLPEADIALVERWIADGLP